MALVERAGFFTLGTTDFVLYVVHYRIPWRDGGRKMTEWYEKTKKTMKEMDIKSSRIVFFLGMI